MPRYIDAEVLRTEINGLRISGLGNKHPEWHDAMWKCLNIILETPTADVRENVHGEWLQMNEVDIDGNAQYQCSVCHAGDLHVPSVEVPFCWKCGAKMGGRDKDA